MATTAFWGCEELHIDYRRLHFESRPATRPLFTNWRTAWRIWNSSKGHPENFQQYQGRPQAVYEPCFLGKNVLPNYLAVLKVSASIIKTWNTFEKRFFKWVGLWPRWILHGFWKKLLLWGNKNKRKKRVCFTTCPYDASSITKDRNSFRFITIVIDSVLFIVLLSTFPQSLSLSSTLSWLSTEFYFKRLKFLPAWPGVPPGAS